MPTHTGVIPVRDINSTVRTNGDIRGPKKNFAVFRAITKTSGEIGTIKLFFRVRGQEIKSLQLETGTFHDGQVTKDSVPSRFTGEKHAPMFFSKCTIFIISNTRGSSAPIDIA